MAGSKAVRADDASGLNIATETITEAAETRHLQRTVINDPTTAANKLGIDASGNAKVIAASNSGVDIGDVTINNSTGAAAVNIQDGGNSITVDGTVGISGTVTVDSELTTADLDTGAGTDTRAVVGLVYGASGGGTLVSTTNPLPVGDNGGSLTVDGTVTANAGTGTFAISAASLPLPSGAATAAKQPALGTAGTASADVITIQGIASMTAVKVDGSGVTQPVSGTVTANLAAGSNNIGDVDVLTLPATPPVTLLSAVISSSSSGDNALVSAAGVGNKIKVVAFELSFSGTVNAKFRSGTTDITGLYYGIANAGAGNSITPPAFLFETAANTALNLNLSGAVAVGGRVTYYIGT